MQSSSGSKVSRMVGIAILIATVVVLQFVATYIKFSFSITLALVPIVIGAAMYGRTAGAVLGGTFGVVVLIGCITGADPGGNILWAANPVVTAALCLLKGALAGFAAGLIYSAVSKKNIYVGVICAALVCPVVNTGIFIAAMLSLYRDTLTQWAGGTPLIYFSFIGLAGINFLIELGVNVVLSPAVVRIINAAKRV